MTPHPKRAKAIDETVRAVLSRPHAQALAPMWIALWSLQEVYGYVMDTREGGVNSWFLDFPGLPRRHLYGNPSQGCVEVRLTTWRNLHPALLRLTGGKQSRHWLATGGPL